MVTHVINRYSEFSDALNVALDEINYPPKGQGRQTTLARDLSKIAKKNITQKAVRKWLEGEGFPRDENIQALCKLTNKPYEYFLEAKLGYTQKLNPKSPLCIQETQRAYEVYATKNSPISFLSSADIKQHTYSGDNYIIINQFQNDFEADSLFAYELTDNSMLPTYKPTDCLVFNRNQKPTPGDVVLAITEHRDIVLGTYSRSSQKSFKITPTNPDWPTLANEDCDLDIIGVRVQSIIN